MNNNVLDQSRRRALNSDPRLICVVIFQGLGDLVLATTALRALRERYRNSQISVLGRSGIVEILANEPYIDELIAAPAKSGGSPIRLLNMFRFVTSLRRRQFDLVVDLTTPLTPSTWIKIACFDRFLAARRVVSPRWRDVQLLTLRRERIAYTHDVHEETLKLRMTGRLITTPVSHRPRLTIPLAATAEIRRRYLSGSELPRVGVAPGAARQSRRWPTQSLIAALRKLQSRCDCQFFLLGDERDIPLTQNLAEELPGVAVSNLAGRISLQQLPALVGSLNVLLCNDSGLMHIASAVGTPLVAILGAESLARYRPLGDPLTTRIFYRKVACSPCRRGACGHRSCTAWIEPDSVAASVQELITPQQLYAKKNIPVFESAMNRRLD